MIPLEYIKNYRFAVYKHNLVLKDRWLISRQFIVLKDSNGIIIAFTRLHNYIKSNKKSISKLISDDGNNRFNFVVSFLNYVFIENYSEYKIETLTDITIEMIRDYFTNYGLTNKNELHDRTKQTVERCATVITDFLIEYITKNCNVCKLKISDFTKEDFYHTRRGILKKRVVPNFDIYYSGKPKNIFRDMPNSVLDIFLVYAAENYKSIFFLIVLSAFAGLRPSEACNVRQEYSPLGAGIMFKKINGETTRIILDLTEERNIRSDLKFVGKIKKERKQGVYPRFLKAFEYAYDLHKKYLSTCKFEKDYCPMSVNSIGKAMTYDLYYKKFKKMTNELIPILLANSDPEVVEYAHDLLEHNISPHIFRHWFSVKLVLYGEDVAGLQYWRGDKNPESALTYLQNKGELEKQLKVVNNNLFDYMNFQAALKKGL